VTKPKYRPGYLNAGWFPKVRIHASKPKQAPLTIHDVKFAFWTGPSPESELEVTRICAFRKALNKKPFKTVGD